MDKITEGAAEGMRGGRYRIVKYVRIKEENPELMSAHEAIIEQKKLAAQEHFYYPETIYRIEPIDREV